MKNTVHHSRCFGHQVRAPGKLICCDDFPCLVGSSKGKFFLLLEEVQFKQFCPPLKRSYPSAENIIETPASAIRGKLTVLYNLIPQKNVFTSDLYSNKVNVLVATYWNAC